MTLNKEHGATIGARRAAGQADACLADLIGAALPMKARKMPGLYAIGEAVDITSWPGGYNFQ